MAGTSRARSETRAVNALSEPHTCKATQRAAANGIAGRPMIENTAEHAPTVPSWLFSQASASLDALAQALRSFESGRCGDGRPARSVRAATSAVSRLQQDLRDAAEFLAGTVQRRGRVGL